MDLTGRTYDDFKALPLEDQVRVVQGDSVEGYERNRSDILSLHLVARAFQAYLKKAVKSSPALFWPLAGLNATPIAESCRSKCNCCV